MAAALPKDLKELVAAEKRFKEAQAAHDAASQALADAEVAVDRAHGHLAAARNALRQIHTDRVANV